MVTKFSRSVAAWSVSALLAGSGFAAGPPRALAKLATLAPGEVKGVAYVAATSAFQDWILGMLPFGDQYREVIDERAQLFEERTGVHPRRDIRGLAIVHSSTGASLKDRHVLFFLDITKDPKRLALALSKDPKLSKHIKFKTPARGTAGEMQFRFVSGGVLFGAEKVMSQLRKRADRGLSDLPALAATGMSDTIRVIAAWAMAAPAGTKSPSEAPKSAREAFSQLRRVALGMDDQAMSLRGIAASAEAAEALRKAAREAIDKGLGGLQANAPAADPSALTLSELMAPQQVAAEATRRWSKRFLDSLELKAEGKTASLVSRGDLMKSTGAFFSVPMIGVLAAIAVPNFQAARARANVRACYANQKTLAGATEMYNLDFNTDIQELSPEWVDKFVANGYLMMAPTDPGQGSGSTENYYMAGTPPLVACRVHGSIDGTVPGSEPVPTGPKMPMGAPSVTGLLRGLMPGAAALGR